MFENYTSYDTIDVICPKCKSIDPVNCDNISCPLENFFRGYDEDE